MSDQSQPTKRVRICVLIDADAKWEAVGSHLWDDNRAKDEAGNCSGNLGRPPWGYHWIEASVPIPAVVSKDVIEGDVSGVEQNADRNSPTPREALLSALLSDPDSLAKFGPLIEAVEKGA